MNLFPRSSLLLNETLWDQLGLNVATQGLARLFYCHTDSFPLSACSHCRRTRWVRHTVRLEWRERWVLFSFQVKAWQQKTFQLLGRKPLMAALAERAEGVRWANPAALEDFVARLFRAVGSCRFMASPPWAAEAGWYSRIKRASASPSLCLISDIQYGKCFPQLFSQVFKKAHISHISSHSRGRVLALCTNCWGLCWKQTIWGHLFMAKWKIALTYTGSILCQSVIYIYITFHFLLTHEKRGISKQSLVLRNGEATPTFNLFPFFILMLLCQSQALSMSYGAIKLHHVFWMFLLLEGQEHQSTLSHSKYMII